MTVADEVSAPADYDQLFRQYYPFVVGLVRKLGIDPQEAEDAANKILLRLMERDVIAMFDEKMQFVRRGNRINARFKSFLSAHVEHYVRGYRDTQNKQKMREPQLCDQPVGDGSTTWIAVFGPSKDDSIDAQASAEASELATCIYQYLRALPNEGRRSSQDVMDLPHLFRMVCRQVKTTGVINAKLLEVEFGVSNTAIHSWLRQLRGHVADFLETERALTEYREALGA